MSERAQQYEAFLQDLGPVVDGDVEALERHADFLVDDDEARDLRHEAERVARSLKLAGADYVHPADFEGRLLEALDGSGALAAVDSTPAEAQQDVSEQSVSSEEGPGGQTTNPGFALPDEDRVALRTKLEDASAAEETGADKDGESQEKGKLAFLPWVLGLGLAAAAAVGLAAYSGGDGAPEAGPSAQAPSGVEGTLGEIDRAADDGRSGVELRRADSDAFVALAAQEPVPAGATIRTDERTRARVVLSDGSSVVLDHATELELQGDRPRGFRLLEGNLVADIAHLEDGPNARFETQTGSVEVLGTKFELSATSEVTNVRVSRGVVTVTDAAGQAVSVNAGEEGVVRAGAAPSVTPFTGLAQELAWSELGGGEGEGAEDDADTVLGIGSLRARRPGERQARERPLTLSHHTVRVRVVGNVARTEIEEVFRNESDQTLEGVYRFPLPADAQIARLALDVEGRMEEGSFVERDRAAAIWRGVIRNATPTRQRRNDEEFIWVPGPWRDPAILEWQRGGQFELRIFPIPAHGERRVILSYTQNVQPQGTRRRYTYPLAHSADDSTRVGRFDLDVRVAGAERVEASGYRVTEAADGSAVRLRMTQEDFTPKGDLTIDYELPGGEREVRFWTYRGEAANAPPERSRERDQEVSSLQRQLAADTRPYVAFALRPELPRATARHQRDYLLVVDVSQSMFGERFERAARLATTVVREMDPRDRFTVLACDYRCQAMPGGLQPTSARAAAEAARWLEAIEPAGASDLSAVLREAVATVSAERRADRELHVMYVGDGTSSVGYRTPAALAAELAELARAENVAVSTIGIGGDADTLALRAIARAAGGHYVPYVPGQRVSVAAMAVLETSYGTSLESPRVQLPDGIADIAPEALPTIRAGEELLVVGRMSGDSVDGEIVLRGTVAGRPFERRYAVQVRSTTAAGNRFVPRLWAAGRIEQLELSGRGEDRAQIIATSKAFGVMSRHTSLLVLESEAMFRAFRVDRNQSPAAQWSGEEDVVAASAEDAGPVVGSLTSGGGRGRVRRRQVRGSGTLGAIVGQPAGASRGEVSSPSASRDNAGPRLPRRTGGPVPTRRAPSRWPGRWMRRVWVRTGEVQHERAVTITEQMRADDAEAALAANPDSRDRHREAVNRLARIGRLDRALEIAEAWVARDREDPEALTAKADLLGRMGHRDDALRLLTGTVDLRPDSGALHRRLAAAFQRAGRPERACAHRVALAEINNSDANAVAAAMRCERSLGRDEAASRLLYSVREGRVRVRAERAAAVEPRERGFGGDFTVDADWSGGDLDLSIVTATGTRLSWMGGRTRVVADRVDEAGRERLGLRYTGPGTYVVEISRTDPADTSEIRGQARIRILGQTQVVPFTLAGENTVVTRVRVRRTSRLEAVTGTVGRREPLR